MSTAPAGPDVIHFFLGCSIDLKDGAIEYERRGHPMSPPVPVQTWRAVPTPEQLARFWARMDEVSAWTLADRSAHAWQTWGGGPTVTDGAGWVLTLSHGAKEVHARGYNEGPNDLAEVKRALQELTGRSDF